MSFSLSLDRDQFDEAFPFFIAVSWSGELLEVGAGLKKFDPLLTAGTNLDDAFEQIRPVSQKLDPEVLSRNRRAVYMLRHRTSGLLLRGQVMGNLAMPYALFLVSPWFQNPEEIEGFGISLNDLAVHDPLADYLLLIQANRVALQDAKNLASKLEEQRLELSNALTSLRETKEALGVRLRQQGLLSELSSEALQKIGVRDLMARTTEIVKEALGADITTIFEVEPGSHVLVLRGGSGLAEGVVGRSRVSLRDGRFLSEVFNASKPVSHNQVAADIEADLPPILTFHEVRSGLGVALNGDQGPFGVLALFCKEPRQFTEDDEGFLRMAGFIISRAMQATLDTQLLNDARTSAEESDKAKSEFLANMSHELRTPMNGIIGLSELVLEEELDERHRSYIESILESGVILLELLNDLLDLSKASSGKFQLDEFEFDLVECVQGAIRVVEYRAVENGIDLALSMAPESPRWLVGDAGRLRQVLVNLLGNAVKFTKGGDVEVVVNAIPSAGSTASLQISISDTGIGIAEHRQAQIFKSFVQADEVTNRMFGGTGLGLAISQQIVNEMGGVIRVKSEEGVGSTFSFEVILKLGDGHDRESSVSTVDAELRSEFEQKKVLVVGADTKNMAAALTYLRFWGCEVSQVSDPEEVPRVLEAARMAGKPVDRVLVDDISHQPLQLKWIRAVRGDPDRFGSPGVTELVPIGNTGCGECERLGKPIDVDSLQEAVLVSSPSNIETVEGLGSSPGALPVSLSVLLVEDNEVNIKLALRILEKAGCEVQVERNGELAVEAVAARTFDLIFMDLRMPVVDGLEATRRIRALEEDGEEHTTIIGMTANALNRDREMCLAAGMDDYLAKPVRVREVREVLMKWSGDLGSDLSGSNTEARGVSAEHAFDIDLALSRMEGDRELLGIALQAFRETAPGILEEMREACAAKDASRLHLAAHSLKGAAGAVCAVEVEKISSRLEATSHTGDLDGSEDMVAAIEGSLSDFMSAVDSVDQ